MKKSSRHTFYALRAILIGAANLGVLILVMKLPGYLPYIITPEKYGPAKSVLLLKYWSNLCLLAWLILGPVLAVAYHILWNRAKMKRIAMETPNALLPLARRRQRNICAACLVLSLLLTTACTIPFVIGVPMILSIKAAKEDLGCLSRGVCVSYTGSFNEIRPGNISAVAGDNAPATIFELYSQYKYYRKGASSSYYFICPIDTGRRLGLAELRRGENPPVEIGPYEIKYLPNTHVITEIRHAQNARDTMFWHESDIEHDCGD